MQTSAEDSERTIAQIETLIRSKIFFLCKLEFLLFFGRLRGNGRAPPTAFFGAGPKALMRADIPPCQLGARHVSGQTFLHVLFPSERQDSLASLRTRVNIIEYVFVSLINDDEVINDIDLKTEAAPEPSLDLELKVASDFEKYHVC